MNNIDRISTSDPVAFADGYLNYLSELLGTLDRVAVGKFIDTLLSARDRNATVFFLGNGGSAATASHFANDIGIGTRSWEKPFRVISLADNIAIITAIANDYGYEDVFKLQLATQLAAGDVVVAISASGNSPNVIKAVEYANSKEAITVGLTGFDGGRLKDLAKISINVSTPKGEYGPVEDVHMVLDHLVGAFLMRASAQ